MAKIRRKKTAVSGQMSVWKSFIDSFNNPMVTTSTSGNYLYISINSEVTVTLGAFNSLSMAFTVTKNGSTSASGTIWSNGASDKLVEITIVSDTNVFYMQIKDGDGRRNLVIYEKLTGINLSGYSLSNSMSMPFIDIKNVTVSNVDGSISGMHSPILTYTTDVGHLDYLSSDIITSGGLFVTTNSNFVSTTPVTADAVYTFNSANYYALGTNTLVEMGATT